MAESRITDDDLYLFNEGSHHRLYDKLGAHLGAVGGRPGTHFAVWAPAADRVSVVGDFNGWDPRDAPLHARGASGIWEGFIPGVAKGATYKFHVVSGALDHRVDKADPFGILHEAPPRTASIVWDLEHEWGDADWMGSRAPRNSLSAPMSIFEVHLGSFKRVPEEGGRSLGYREMAVELGDYVLQQGYTHVELLPVMEHPFGGSWGYQVTGYFAPTHRFGKPQDLMYLVDYLHRAGIGVILDWVPAHFPTDEHGPGYFDGTHLYEHADPRQGFHPDWKTFVFNYGRHEVRSFLASSALFWLDRYHVDGLRVDGVASMLYLDYSREDGEWIPNEYGGRENLEAISFLRRTNEAVYGEHPDVQMIAEESTAWPGVSRPVYAGGLGFGLKWDMGWMHDTLQYFSRDPVHRKFHHGELTFRSLYAFHENFVLPLSHDEVVHGKGSLLSKMPGDEWQQLANLRLLFAYMWAMPGKKLLFMGGDLGQRKEWSHDESVEWHLAERPGHRGVQRLVADLNRLYREKPALHVRDCESRGFEWIEADDAEHGLLAFKRTDGSGSEVLAVLNFTPVPHDRYRLGVDRAGSYRELLNTDAEVYAGTGRGNLGGVTSTEVPHQGCSRSVVLALPPLAAVYLEPEP